MNSLDVPDSLLWKHLPHYSEDVASRLIQAYGLINRHHDHAAAYERAARLVSPMLMLRMAPPQRVRIHYVLALGLAALADYRDCLVQLDKAYECAGYLEDASALSALLYLRACANRELFHYRLAAADFRRSLDLLIAAELQGQPVEPLQVVHLLTCEATVRFYLGEYEAAERLLEGAQVRVPAGAEASLEARTILWIRALIYRWTGNPWRALPAAQKAAEAYMGAEPSASAVRIQTFVAEIGLDLAEDAPSGSSRRAFLLEGVSSHLDVALRLARPLRDANGEVRTQILQARASRLRGESIGRVGLIETLAQEGQRLNDDLLVVQAFTTLGDELMANGEEASGLNCYREVFNLTDGGDLVAFTHWARHAYENNPDWYA